MYVYYSTLYYELLTVSFNNNLPPTPPPQETRKYVILPDLFSNLRKVFIINSQKIFGHDLAKRHNPRFKILTYTPFRIIFPPH